MAMILNSLPAYIGWGTSESTVVDTGGNYVVGLIMPETWTPAHITVLASTDNATWRDLFIRAPDRTSLVQFVFNFTPHSVVSINPNRMLMARYIKLRSGTRNEPINQTETVAFTVITVDAASPGGPAV
jgi:hypothetical protein